MLVTALLNSLPLLVFPDLRARLLTFEAQTSHSSTGQTIALMVTQSPTNGRGYSSSNPSRVGGPSNSSHGGCGGYRGCGSGGWRNNLLEDSISRHRMKYFRA
ncbi:hypothetical protein L3X38_014738 [Prunus dulcis]|uniref:Secreted protein n=1 Tax=Prunus dulcis TaxID=3755 RepID=A0AAD4WNY1_PRUDU|nr:hypothetical protein L3X38_014738 [Prunus dulcis]